MGGGAEGAGRGGAEGRLDKLRGSATVAQQAACRVLLLRRYEMALKKVLHVRGGGKNKNKLASNIYNHNQVPVLYNQRKLDLKNTAKNHKDKFA